MKNRKKIYYRWKFLLVGLFLLAGCALLGGKPVLAADNEVKISSCKLAQNGRMLTVKATVKKKKAAMGKKLYLIGLDSYQASSGKISAKPVASVPTRKGSIVFQVKYDSSMLCQQFVVAYKSGSKYKIASNARYITNPEALATYKGTGAKTYSKKGLYAEYGEVCDPIALGTQHIVMNWTINEMFRTMHTTRTIKYIYRGKTYYFDADVMDYHDTLVQQYVASGARVYVILLLRYGVSKDTASMCYGKSGASFSSINITNQKGCLAWEALMTYLGKRYAAKENLISGWVLGNEVDSPGDWNYGGGKRLSAYMTDYAAAYRICYNAVKSNSKNSNVYISLDYN